MRRVVIESPFAAGKGLRGVIGRWLNRRYARRCLRDSLKRGEAPLASHLLYTQRGVLDDGKPLERHLGITAGLAWAEVADASVVYVDRGLSNGMKIGIEKARSAGIPVEFRMLRRASVRHSGKDRAPDDRAGLRSQLPIPDSH